MKIIKMVVIKAVLVRMVIMVIIVVIIVIQNKERLNKISMGYIWKNKF